MALKIGCMSNNSSFFKEMCDVSNDHDENIRRATIMTNKIKRAINEPEILSVDNYHTENGLIIISRMIHGEMLKIEKI